MVGGPTAEVISAAGYLFNAAADEARKKQIEAKIAATMAPLVGKQFTSADAAAIAITEQTSLRQISYDYNIEIGVEFVPTSDMPTGAVYCRKRGDPIQSDACNSPKWIGI